MWMDRSFGGVSRGEFMVKWKIFRIVMLVAGATGLLALFESVAHASTGTDLNHCEPLQRI
jgi:hypothetical protein